ncbi:DUF411 domain-containing protein [Gammaproteobacteria bacterium AS21]
MQQHANILSLWRKSYRAFFTTVLLIVMITRVPLAFAETITDSMTVYKSSSCGCCTAWVDHMKDTGIKTSVRHPSNLNIIKQKMGVKPAYHACHTAIMQGYVFEGHIPAAAIEQFLQDKPANAIGLAVPGMPMGSPGMETNKAFKAYQVLLLNKDGSSTPYASVSAQQVTYLGDTL